MFKLGIERQRYKAALEENSAKRLLKSAQIVVNRAFTKDVPVAMRLSQAF